MVSELACSSSDLKFHAGYEKGPVLFAGCANPEVGYWLRKYNKVDNTSSIIYFDFLSRSSSSPRSNTSTNYK